MYQRTNEKGKFVKKKKGYFLETATVLVFYAEL